MMDNPIVLPVITSGGRALSISFPNGVGQHANCTTGGYTGFY